MKPYLKQVNVIAVPALSKDGEVYTAHKNIKIVVDNEKDFFMTYSHLTGYISNCKSASELKLLHWICKNSDYNNSIVTLNKFYKAQVNIEMGISIPAINKAISVFTKSSILIKNKECPKCGMYFINPIFVWKGDSRVRKDKMKMTLELIQTDNTPEKEQEVENDIKRYKEYYDSLEPQPVEAL